jgi:AGZA family xanthine/uracil permease-like MFS transporter
MNGLATLGASFFGSAFPTTLYFGHISHKANGARIGYSILNAVVIALICLTGTVPLVLHFLPYQLVAFIIVWFGLEMVGQAFAESGRRHGVAVAVGLLPLVCAWGLQLLTTCLERNGISLADAVTRLGSDVPLRGLIVLSQGAFLVSMVWAAATSHLVDRRFFQAALWFLAGSFLSFFGIIHAFVLTGAGLENHLGFGADWPFAVSYAMAALFLVGCELYSRRTAQSISGELPSLPTVEDPSPVTDEEAGTAFARITPPT